MGVGVDVCLSICQSIVLVLELCNVPTLQGFNFSWSSHGVLHWSNFLMVQRSKFLILQYLKFPTFRRSFQSSNFPMGQLANAPAFQLGSAPIFYECVSHPSNIPICQFLKFPSFPTCQVVDVATLSGRVWRPFLNVDSGPLGGKRCPISRFWIFWVPEDRLPVPKKFKIGKLGSVYPPSARIHIQKCDAWKLKQVAS